MSWISSVFESCSFSLMRALYNKELLIKCTSECMTLHLYPNYKSLWYSTLGPKTVLYSIDVCCAVVWLDETESHGSYLAAEITYPKFVFIHFIHSFRFEPVLGWICYAGNQFLSHVNEVHSTSLALCNYIPPIKSVKFLKLFYKLSIYVQRTVGCHHVQ